MKCMATLRTGSIEIACDESGNTGENLVAGGAKVFSEGSHDLSVAESAEVLDWIRNQIGQSGSEIKWRSVRKHPSLVEELFGTKLIGRARFYLTEKLYFTVGKVIDLLIEERYHSQGRDLYASGSAKRMALDLYRGGPRALERDQWTALLVGFNSLMRRDSSTQKLKAIPKTTVDEFYAVVDMCRWASKRRAVSEILGALVDTKKFADEFVAALDPQSSPIPALDPLVPSLAQSTRHWFDDSSAAEIRVLHDEGPVPSSTAMGALAEGLRHPREFWRYGTAVNLVDIETGNSSTDPRLQVADLVAGFGATCGGLALDGQLHPSFLELANLTILPSSLWGDEKSGLLLGLRG